MVRVDANDEAWTYQETLRRIIALLFSLADLADWTSSCRYDVRCKMLAILRRGEAIAHRSVIGTAQDLGVAAPPQAWLAIRALMLASDGDDPDDATGLALRFRALAFALVYLLSWCEAAGALGVGRNALQRPASVLPWKAGRPIQAHRPLAPDTS
jgi:hypothetical protein